MKRILEILVCMIIGALIAWFWIPRTTITLPGVNTTSYDWITDTIIVPDTIYLERIRVKPEFVSKRDTLFIDSVPMPTDLIAEYDRLTDSLINLSFARMKFYSKITNSNDTINVNYEAIRDSIINLEINLAARQVMKKQIRTVYVPKTEKEEWWIKPVIGVGGIIVGYGLGSLK